jgi:predicted ribosomally synthesized peptide with SipW-like signal peptide
VRKVILSLIILLLTAVSVAGYSLAYFTDELNDQVPTFTAGTVQIKFDGNHRLGNANTYVECKEVNWTIKNAGTSEIYIRVKPLLDETVDFHPLEGDFEYVTADLLDLEGDIQLMVSSEDWIEGEDGYYYYVNPIEREGCAVFSLTLYFDLFENVETELDIEVEAIQATNDAIIYEWPDNPLQYK